MISGRRATASHTWRDPSPTADPMSATTTPSPRASSRRSSTGPTSQTASPGTFHGLDFCRGFFRWHNEEHCHSGIGLLTPAVVHTGQATAVLEARASVLAAAHARHPERFVQGVPRPLAPAAEVWINPPENRPTVRTLELPRDTTFVPQLSQSH